MGAFDSTNIDTTCDGHVGDLSFGGCDHGLTRSVHMQRYPERMDECVFLCAHRHPLNLKRNKVHCPRDVCMNI